MSQAREHGSVALDGAVVRDAPDPLTGSETYDAATLFHLASDAQRQHDYPRATALYQRFLSEFPTSPMASPATFNLGLVYEAQLNYAAAEPLYRQLGDIEYPAEEDAGRTWIDAHFRLAVVLGKLDRWWESVAAFDRVLEREELSTADRFEALVGRGLSMRLGGDAESADVALSHALRFFQALRERDLFDDRGLAAEAAFHLGQIADEKYQKVQLEFPVELLQKRLEEKCAALLTAQNRYLRAIRFGDAHTVAAAGFLIGNLYETLYSNLVELEVPSELDAEQVTVYQEEVRNRVRVLLEKAMMVYERALPIGKTAGTAAPWVDKMTAALERLKTLYLATAQDPEKAS